MPLVPCISALAAADPQIATLIMACTTVGVLVQLVLHLREAFTAHAIPDEEVSAEGSASADRKQSRRAKLLYQCIQAVLAVAELLSSFL